MLAVLFTLPRLRTLRPAALRKLSSEGTLRNDADADPENTGMEENPIFAFEVCVSLFGVCACEYVCSGDGVGGGDGCRWVLACGTCSLLAPVYRYERVWDLWEWVDRMEVVERAAWELYGVRRADEGEGGCAGESGGDRDRGGVGGRGCEPSAKGPEMVGRPVNLDREVVEGDLRVRLMSRFRPFCCPCPSCP